MPSASPSQQPSTGPTTSPTVSGSMSSHKFVDHIAELLYTKLSLLSYFYDTDEPNR